MGIFQESPYEVTYMIRFHGKSLSDGKQSDAEKMIEVFLPRSLAMLSEVARKQHVKVNFDIVKVEKQEGTEDATNKIAE